MKNFHYHTKNGIDLNHADIEILKEVFKQYKNKNINNNIKKKQPRRYYWTLHTSSSIVQFEHEGLMLAHPDWNAQANCYMSRRNYQYLLYDI